MKKKIIYGILVAVVLGVIGVWFFVFYLPTTSYYKRDVAKENGISITAVQLVKNFQANEDSANKIYLNKAIEITGQVQEAKMDEGHPVIILKSEDSFSSIYCSFTNDPGEIQAGTTITVKGLCIGFLSDVRIIEAVVTKK